MSGWVKVAAWLMPLLLSASQGDAVAGKAEIRIRLINALNGKPYANRHAGLFGTNGGMHANEILFHIETKTGHDGVAHFLLTKPLPYYLVLDIGQNDVCAWPGVPTIFSSTVLKSGYIGPNECARKNQSFHWEDVKAEPGEIILFAVEPRWFPFW